MLDALQLLRYFGAGFWPLLLQALCLLLQDRQPHGDVEPIEKMLAERMKILLYSANIFATVGHEHHLLIFLHSFRFHQLPETPAYFQMPSESCSRSMPCLPHEEGRPRCRAIQDGLAH